MLVRAVLVAVATALTLTAVASAHVTMNPGEWEAGGFARFALRVPNERPDASTTEVTLQFPENVISASFQDVEGWERTVEMAQLEEPVEQFGEEITERIASVTWSGGEVEPGEFVEFPISFQVPEDAAPGEALLFPSLQTYSGGEIVRWLAEDEEADTPAPRVAVLAAAGEGGGGTTTTEEEPAADEQAEAAPTTGGDDDDGKTTLALILGIAGLAAGLVALGIALMRRPGADRATPAA